jgi:glycosyltransferase involved in cell wall biosynthesis
MDASNMSTNSHRICIITSPRGKAGVVPLSNLIEILKNLVEDLYIITGNEGELAYKDQKGITGYSIHYNSKNLLILRLFCNFLLQLKIALKLVKIRNKYDLFIFFMAEGLTIPIGILKLFGKETILNLAASSPMMIGSHAYIPLIKRIERQLESINYFIADKIILYSPRLVSEWKLENYADKILFASEHLINSEEFCCSMKLGHRDTIVGYIGRLSEEKGILNLIGAIEILRISEEINFIIGGDGPLKNQLLEYISANKLGDRVKLLVLPSYTEGLPNIMLEAMACETLVLATPVGAIPDYLADGTNGFIMKDNSPNCIADSIGHALNHPDKELIASNARDLIIHEFTLDSAICKWRKIVEKFESG